MNNGSQVVLRPIGSSLALGLAGLTIASLVLSGLELSWVPASAGHDVGILVLVSGAGMQAVACVFAFLARDGAAGSALGILSSTWTGIGLIHLVAAPGSTTPPLGLLLLAAGALLLCGSSAVGMSKAVPALAIGLTGLRFVLTGIYELSANGTWQDVSGIVGLVVTAVAGYAVWALMLEDARDRPLLPVGRHGQGRAAIAGSFDEQVAGLAHEAGVRRQL